MSTNKLMFIKPGEKNIRDPERGFKHVPKYGAPVPRNSYWLRRLRDEDVTETTKEEFEKAKAAAEKLAAKKAAAEKAAAEKKAADQVKAKTNNQAKNEDK